MFNADGGEWPNLVISGAAPADQTEGPDISRSESHGGFDNDPYTMNSVLFRILGEAPPKEKQFTLRDLQF